MLFHIGLIICMFMHNAGTERQYLIIQDSQLLCEVQRCSDEPRSWFVGESVQTGQKCVNNGEEGSKMSYHTVGGCQIGGSPNMADYFSSSNQFKYLCSSIPFSWFFLIHRWQFISLYSHRSTVPSTSILNQSCKGTNSLSLSPYIIM